MPQKSDTAERMVQANRLIGLATSVAEANDALVVCGDFNVEQDSNALDILAEARLYDLVTAHGFSGTRIAVYKKSGRFADYLLVSEKIKIGGFKAFYSPEVPDHCALILDVWSPLPIS
ncbi:endonuclease/exonuclease/phosphatase family protein [uncultured Boseongicola sp.]|uniref:endonuclease/exonuclease/phosphatase family protein n=1 Tax=uncultured Boseongicola sp. TaxID=1648499 RepID=UPI0026108ADF|nr:endonuclease/exonuclease/phosphatase family protein [uncultured Boseongicola sp.]